MRLLTIIKFVMVFFISVGSAYGMGSLFTFLFGGQLVVPSMVMGFMCPAIFLVVSIHTKVYWDSEREKEKQAEGRSRNDNTME